MIAFSGFMQAINGFAPAFGNKNVGIETGDDGLPGINDGISSFDDRAGSFMEWVQKIMDSNGPVQAEGESVLGLQNGDPESDRYALDQLQTLIADAMNPTAADPPESQAPIPAPSGEWKQPVPQVIIDALIAHNDGRWSGNNHGDKALPVIQKVLAAMAKSSAVGQDQPATDDQSRQTNAKGILDQTGQADVIPRIENPLTLNTRENTPEAGVEKEKTHFPAIPVSPAGDEKKNSDNRSIQVPVHSGGVNATKPIEPLLAGQHANDRLIQEQVSSGSGNAEKETDAPPTAQNPADRLVQEPIPPILGAMKKVIEPAIVNQHPMAGSTKDRESVVTVLADPNASSSEDDTANSHSNDPPRQPLRLESADINQNELKKGQSLDSVKSTISDPNSSQPSFQDTAKSITADQSTNIAVKPTTGQAAATATLSQPEESAAKTFQTTVMDQIVDKAAMRSIHGRSEIQIRLKPEFLGNVQMNIASDKDQLVVRILTDQPVVKEIIETHLHHLKMELQNQGLTIDKFDIMVNPDADQHHSREQFAQMFKNNSFQNSRRKPQEQNPDASDQGDANASDDDQPGHDGVNYFA